MRKYVLAIVGLILLCLLAALGTASGSPDTVTVDSTTDVSDGVTSSISNLIASPGSDGVISLREAIEAANNNAGTDTIEFNIPVTDTGYEVSGITGTWTISLSNSLPTLTGGGTIISGTTQAANQGDLNLDGPEIEITGAGVGSGNCLQVASASNVIHGLVINRCPYSGVGLTGSGATTNTVSGNYIGTDATGTQDLGNYWHGVFVGSGAHSNFIGGDTSGERNIISGNNMQGVIISGSGAVSNTISGNYIGTGKTGMQDLPNTNSGVYIQAGAQYNLVGGDTSEERNVISGNGYDGVRIASAMSNTISGNYIGTGALGSSAVCNWLTGIRISGDAPNNVVGGVTGGERNIISGNKRNGVEISSSGAMGNTISGNYIGTDPTGTEDLGNGWDGVYIWGGAQHNTVGGGTEGERNIISGNNSDGVVIEDSGTTNNTVSGNFIGTVVTGTEALGNGFAGVIIQDSAQNNTIGGTTGGERNVISGNNVGVSINGSGTMSNTISGNYVGTDASGSSELGNANFGVSIAAGAQNNTVGGDTSGERNVISGNNYGVDIYHSGTDGNTVSGNYIGTDATGTQDLGNTYDGVLIEQGAQNNTVGGQTAGERNVISGNFYYGVGIWGSGTMSNTISGNYIGTDVTGTQDKGNGRGGVRIDDGAQNNIIGPDNLIAHNNLGDGILVGGSTSTGNTITQNAIHSNGDLGIDLDGGSNGEISAPAVSAANACFVSGTADAGDTVEVFTGPDEEGKTYLATALADGAGQWGVVGDFTLDTYVTATATDASGNSSEFSAQAAAETCYPVFVPLAMKGY